MGVFDIFRKRKTTVTKRNYDGVQTGRLFADFISSQRSADSEIRYNLKTLRNRSRDLSRNNEYAKRYLRLLRQNVVGERGVQLQVKAINPDGRLDQAGNNIVEAAWRKWCEMGNCTVDGKLSFVDAQELFIESLARDGEVIIRMVRYDGNPDRFAIQFLEADYLDEDKNEILRNGNRIRMGVEVDPYGRPVAYHLFTEHPNDLEYPSQYNREYQRLDAEMILHVYMPDRSQQTRGVPFMSTAISALKMLHGYREAELVAARTAACKTGFFTSPAGDGFAADDIDNNVPLMEAEAGTFHQLPAGVEFTPFDPSHPTSAFAEFEKSILRGIASGLGVSYHSLANDLTQTSYSSIRQGTIEDRDFYRLMQRFMIQHFIQPVFRQWLLSAMTSGTVVLPIDKYDKFANAANFQPRGFSWIDPQKEINAHVTALQNGLISMQDVQNQYGRDVEDTFAQISRDKEIAQQFGLSMAFEPFGAPKFPVEPDIVEAEDGD